MKICIDVRCLIQGRRTGVEEYTLNLLFNLFEIDHENEYVLFFSSWKKPKFDFLVFEKYPNVKIKKLKIPNKLLNFLFWYFSWPKIDRLVGGADLIFMPNIIFGAVSSWTKLVLTVHDLSFERYPEFFSSKRRWWHIFINPKKICQRADKIIAVSNSTKNDLISLYKVKPKNIQTIYSAVADKFKPINRNSEKLIKTKEKYHLPYKFILYLGTIEPRKNIISLVRAYNQWREFALNEKRQDLGKFKLVIAGEKGWLAEPIFREIENSRFRESIQIINFVSDEDKEYVYNLASLFVYPSFFEGFGFPPLEAMRCGVPVIVSNNSSFPEVVGQAAIMVDPNRSGEICQAMKEILLNKEFREKIILKGVQKAREFNWQETAREVLKIISEVV